MAEGGYWMIRTIRSGRVIEKSQFYVGERKPRAKRRKGNSSAKKKDGNAMSAVRRYARLMNCNFAAGAGMLLTLHYDAEHLPADKAAAERELENFWRRLGYRLKKAGCELKATGITSELDGETGERVRLHHHLVISREGVTVTRNERGELRALVGGVELREVWKLGGVDIERISEGQEDLTGIAVYFLGQVEAGEDEKRWKSTRNLKKPVIESERVCAMSRVLRAPGGATVSEVGHYDEANGSHYIRYIRRPRQKVGGSKEMELARGELDEAPPETGGGR